MKRPVPSGAIAMDRLSLLATLILLFTHNKFADAFTTLMTSNGVQRDVPGYPGLVYQAVRYEPLCGNLGSDTRFSEQIDIEDYCIPAIDAFGNNTEDTIALYDTTGSRLKNARVGGGYDVCLCFALSQSGSGIKGGLCLWVDGSGSSEVMLHIWYDRILRGNYRPNIEKALPLCADIDLSSLKEKWSGTAFQPSATERLVTMPGLETTVVPTYIPSEYTTVLTLTTTDANGSPTVRTTTHTTEVTVVAVEPTSKGLSRSDKIALGVGLGIGIPTIGLMTLGLCIPCLKRRG